MPARGQFTSLGWAVPPPELPLDGIGPKHVVNDLVYQPGGTAWLNAAAGRGALTVDGLGMLLHRCRRLRALDGRPRPDRDDARRVALRLTRRDAVQGSGGGDRRAWRR